MQEARIVEAEEKKMVGARIINSLSNDKTGALWQSFMPKRHLINHRVDNSYYSVQSFAGGLNPEKFTEETQFEKWAAVEVSAHDTVPEHLEPFTIPEGKYAVFIHHGLASEFHKLLQYIYETWLPGSDFHLDARPHFEIMGDKYYGPTDANSEEEVWIPIK